MKCNPCNAETYLEVVELCKPEEEKPILIAYLARKMGYKGYKTLEAGTPVYSFKGMYFIDMESDNSLAGVYDKRQNFYPRSFEEHPDLLNYVVRDETKKK